MEFDEDCVKHAYSTFYHRIRKQYLTGIRERESDSFKFKPEDRKAIEKAVKELPYPKDASIDEISKMCIVCTSEHLEWLHDYFIGEARLIYGIIESMKAS